MNNTIWSQNMLKNEPSQQKLEHAVEVMLNAFLGDKAEYTQEKTIKLFCESIRDLENALLHKFEIHPHNLDYQKVMINKENYLSNYKKVEQIIDNEIALQSKRFNTLLTESNELPVTEFKVEFVNKEIQEEIEDKIQFFLDMPLSDKSNEVKQAFKECYTLPMKHLEESCLYSRGIHPEQNPNLTSDDYKDKQMEVEKILKSELSRHQRLFIHVL